MRTGYNATGHLRMLQGTTNANPQAATRQAHGHEDHFKGGHKVQLAHLTQAVDLNGKIAIVRIAENDDGKIVVQHDERLLRLKRAHLIALDQYVFDEKDDERPRKAMKMTP